MGTDFINSKNEFFNAEDIINEELKNEINEINLLISFSLKDKTMSPDDIKKRIYYILDNSACMSPDAKDVCLFSKAGDAGLLAFRRLAILSLEANAFQKALGQICSIIGLGECRLVTNGEGGSIVVNFKSEQFYNENQTLISPQDFVKHLQLNNMI